LADKLSNMLLEALARSALAPQGTPLIGTKVAPGLFPTAAAARQASQRAIEDGLIRKVSTDPKGKPDRDLYAATDTGLAFLLKETNPKQVLEDIARAIETRQAQVAEVVANAGEIHMELAAIKRLLSMLNDRPPAASALDWIGDLRRHLSDWDSDGTSGDFPLPDLYRRLKAAHPDLTIGRFHDGVRELHDREQVYLHPWTGPLYALPEPAYALLIGHEIAYYASARAEVSACGPAALNERSTNGVLV
jgi:hypothetical protein